MNTSPMIAKHLDYYGSTEPNLVDNLQVRLEIAALSKLSASWAEMNRVREFHKFYFFLEGRGWIRIGGIDYEPKPGQLFLLPAGVEHSFHTDPQHPFKKYWCHFFANVGSVPLFEMLQAPAYVEVTEHSVVETLFRQLIDNAKRRNTAGHLMVKSTLIECIAYFLDKADRRMSSRIGKSSHAIKLEPVLAYMEQHLAYGVTVEALSRIAHLSPNYFNRYFHEVFGVPPIQYMNRLKIEKAKQLLLSSNASVGEAAAALGWELYYFSRVFKKMTGYAPHAYRKLFRE
jgi:AraC-like DNA-binding protein